MYARELTPPYARYLIRFIRPFPNWDFFFIKPLRKRAADALQLEKGSRVLDAGCGPGGMFPYLADLVGPTGEVVGLEISPEVAMNARKRIEANQWTNVDVLVGNAKSAELIGRFDALVMFAAPDVYASPDAIANLFSHLKDGARVVVFGAKLSRRRSAPFFNRLFRTLMKLSFSSTPGLTYDPLSVLSSRLTNVNMQEYIFGCMFLASASFHQAERSA